MMWSSIFVALFIAIALTLVLVGLLGWRRPGSPQAESVVMSAVFFFAVLFLATWAIGVWMAPFGPVAWGVPWLGWLVVAVVVALLLGAALQPGLDRSATGLGGSEPIATGFGVFFWALIIALLVAALAGSWREW